MAKNATNSTSAHSRLLPYIEQTNLYNAINFSVAGNNALNAIPLARTRPEMKQSNRASFDRITESAGLQAEK